MAYLIADEIWPNGSEPAPPEKTENTEKIDDSKTK